MQLWIALPARPRYTARAFDHYAPSPITRSGGRPAGCSWEHWPACVHPCSPTPARAQIDLPAGASVDLEVDPGFEHGLLLDRGDATVAGAAVRPNELAYVGAGADVLTVTNTGTRPARAVLLGGTPFGEGADDVVELRRPLPAESRGIPGTVAGAVGPVRPGVGLPGCHRMAAGTAHADDAATAAARCDGRSAEDAGKKAAEKMPMMIARFA